jgi:hypothetical protein
MSKIDRNKEKNKGRSKHRHETQKPTVYVNVKCLVGVAVEGT